MNKQIFGGAILGAVGIAAVSLWAATPSPKKPVIVADRPAVQLEWRTFACQANGKVRNIYENARAEVAHKEGNSIRWRVFVKDKTDPTEFEVNLKDVKCGYMQERNSK